MAPQKRVKKEKTSEGNLLPVPVGGGRALTAREFQGLAELPPEAASALMESGLLPRGGNCMFEFQRLAHIFGTVRL